jgi:hypothetical protein
MYIEGASSTFSVPLHVLLAQQAEAIAPNVSEQNANPNESASKTNENVNTTEKDQALKDQTSNESTRGLSEDEQKKVEELKARDAEVRQHEEAHRSTAGPLASAPQYEYESGPDGKQYAVGGHVNINTSKGKTPEETIQRAQTVRRAALAPASPSGQDRKVAQKAAQTESEARAEIAKEQQDNVQSLAPEATTETTASKVQPATVETKESGIQSEDATTPSIDPNSGQIAIQSFQEAQNYADLTPQNRSELDFFG